MSRAKVIEGILIASSLVAGIAGYLRDAGPGPPKPPAPAGPIRLVADHRGNSVFIRPDGDGRCTVIPATPDEVAAWAWCDAIDFGGRDYAIFAGPTGKHVLVLWGRAGGEMVRTLTPAQFIVVMIRKRPPVNRVQGDPAVDRGFAYFARHDRGDP